MNLRLLLIAFILAGIQAGAQNTVTISQEICDSIKTINPESKRGDVVLQFNIQQAVLKNYPDLVKTDTSGTSLHNTNKYLHTLVKQTGNICKSYVVESKLRSGEVSIIDQENLFSAGQTDTLQLQIEKLRKNKAIGLLIVSVDDIYPYSDLRQFAIGQGYVWSIGSGLSKGGVVVAFSKKLKRVRISTSSLSKKFLPDKDAQSLIDKVLIPKFTRGQYYKAMIELVDKLEKSL